MSEMTTQEQGFGVAGVEAGQGFEKMPVAYPVPKEEQGDTFGSDYSGIEQAADELSKSRQEGEKPVEVERYYQHIGGEKHGERRDAKEVVSADQASWDLANVREADAMARQAAEKLEINAAIEQLRAGDEQQQTPIQDPIALDERLAPPPAVQQEPNAQFEGDEVARALQNPAVLAAVQQAVAQEQAKSEYAMNQYAKAVIQNGQVAAASLVANFPELQNLQVHELGTAIQVINQRDPQRAQQIVNYIDRIQPLVDQAVQVGQQQLQRQAAVQRAQFEAGAKQVDAHYAAWADQQVSSPQERAEIEAEALAGLRGMGLSDQQIYHEYNSNPSIRGLFGQQQLFMAAAYRVQQKKMVNARRTKLDRSAPPVQRPGSPAHFADEADQYLRTLEKPGRNLTPREAASYVTARRNAARR